MMGPEQHPEPKLFYTNLSLERRVPPEHALRRIRREIDFSFVRAEVAPLYGTRGNPSVDPAVLLKLNFLLFYENVSSERQLMEQMPMRLDWLWFCGYDLDSDIPDHSVLSKARRRWGPEVFAGFFTRIVAQCIETGLVDGSTVHVDASVVTADASRETVRPVLRKAAEALYARLEETADAGAGNLTSTTDPDARMTRTQGEAVLGYKEHRVVDDRSGIITATETTGAATSEAHVLPALLDAHAAQLGESPQTVVADRQYGTAENYRAIERRGAEACIPHERRSHPEGTFPPEAFRYDAARDVFVCPAGELLTRWNREPSRQRTRYKTAKGVCALCALRSQCTEGKLGRLVGRHELQDYIDRADALFSKAERKRLMQRRKAVVEGSFADAANRHGFKRARWRGLVKVRIQNLLIAAVQNVRKLMRAWRRGRGAAAQLFRCGASAAASLCRGVLSGQIPGCRALLADIFRRRIFSAALARGIRIYREYLNHVLASFVSEIRAAAATHNALPG
jgi:transposase